MSPAEQSEVSSVALVAVAVKVVTESSATATEIPGEANSAGLPVATGVPEQSAVVNRASVESDRAVPLICGLFSKILRCQPSW